MTKVVFEAASLAVALAAASKVAPTKGEAFDKAAGIVLDVTADECIVMATDTLVRYSTWLTPEAFEGESVSWRLPSRMFADLIGKLKTVREKTLVLEQDGSTLRMTHGRTRAQFILMDAESYPRWTPFSPDDMHEVIGLGKAVAAVAWAAAKSGDAPLIGVHLDGNSALATDKYKFSSAPCVIDLKEPITIPPAAITSILKPNVSVLMRVEGSQVYIMPDDYTQIALTAYGVDYLPVQKIMIREYPVMGKIKKQDLLDAIELAMTMVGADRMPTLYLIFGRQEIAVMVRNEEKGLVGHQMETPEQFDFPIRHELRFNPDNFMGALSNCVGDNITIGFDMSTPKAGVYLAGADDIEFWVAPRSKVEATA